MTTLQDISLFITDGKHGDCQNEDNSGYYFISCKDVKDGWVDYSSARQITEEDYLDTHKRTRLEANDILITNSGTIGRMALIRRGPETNRTTFQKSVAIIKPNQEKIIPRWLYYYLNSKKEALTSWAGGTAQKNLLLRDLRAFELTVPSLATQRKIAAILSTYDNLIENNNRRIKILEDMARLIYQEWFVNFLFPNHENVKIVNSPMGRIPEGWSIKNLFEVADITYGFPFKSNLFTSKQDRVAVIRIRDLVKNSTETYTTEIPSMKYLIQNGDLLVGMDGDFHMCKWAGANAYLNQRVVRFKPTNGLSAYYLYLALEAPISYFDATITGTTVAHLGDKHLRSIDILVPDEIGLQHISKVFNPLFDEELNLRVRNVVLRNTRDLLLPKLISGEIDVSELDIDIGEEVP